MEKFMEAEMEFIRFGESNDIITTSAQDSFDGEWDVNDDTLKDVFGS